jgi:broad specificity phosphatase PhoE
VSEAPLLLIRHAESSWNAAGRWQGHGDPPLSDRGRAQADALARELARESIDIVVSSDLRRAAETAAILAEARGLRPLLNPRLRELDLGDWEGLTRDQIERTAGDALRRFDDGDLDVRPGGGENLREIEQRAFSAVTELVDAHPGRRLAIVTHLGVIRALFGESCGSVCGVGAGSVPSGPRANFDNASWRRLDPVAIFDSAARKNTAPRHSRGLSKRVAARR